MSGDRDTGRVIGFKIYLMGDAIMPGPVKLGLGTRPRKRKKLVCLSYRDIEGSSIFRLFFSSPERDAGPAAVK